MTSATQIVRNAPAFIRSTCTTLIAVVATVGGIASAALAFGVVPEDKKPALIAISAGAITIGTALRQTIAWLDKNNLSFGRVNMLPTLDVPDPVDSVAQSNGDTPPPAGPDDVVTLDETGAVLGNEGVPQ